MRWFPSRRNDWCFVHCIFTWSETIWAPFSPSPLPPLLLPLLYLLFLPFKDTSISWCEVSFLTALPSFYIFVCRNSWHTCTDSWKSNHRTSGFHWPMNTLMVMNMFHRKRNRKAQHPHSSINLYIKLSSQAKMLTFSSRYC